MRLYEYMETNQLSRTDFAAQLGVTPQLVWLWLKKPDKHKPGSSAMQKIIELTKGSVTANDFYGLPAPPKRNGKHRSKPAP